MGEQLAKLSLVGLKVPTKHVYGVLLYNKLWRFFKKTEFSLR